MYTASTDRTNGSKLHRPLYLTIKIKSRNAINKCKEGTPILLISSTIYL